MARRRATPLLLAALLALATAAAIFHGGPARADTLVLKDGTVLEGTVIKQAEHYWVKTTDGQSRLIPFADVKSHTRGSAGAGAGTGAGALPAGTSADFSATRRKAEAVDTALAAVAIWQKFLDSTPPPSAAAAAAAKAELERWQKMADEGAERIGGKWLSGNARKAIVEKASKLMDEAGELMRKQQTLAAVKKLEEAHRVYPHPDTAFFLGYINLTSKREGEAIRYFEQGLKLMPGNVEAMNNVGVALIARGEHARGVEMIYKAAQARDSKELAQNLVTALAELPERVRQNANFRAATEAAQLLAGRHGIAGPIPQYHLLPPVRRRAAGEDPTPGGLSSGSGFIIAEDGLILTNRHVVDDAKTLMVLLPGGVRRSAEVVKVDDKQDLALIRIKPDGKLPVVPLAEADKPNEGAQCFVLGFPLLDRMGATLKITQGIVSGGARPGSGADVVIDAKVNPGNSGGPLVDNRGQVIGIVTMKTSASELEDSYGIAISAGRIRAFLAANNVTPPTAPAPAPAPAPDKTLTAEEIAAKLKPATVCILAVH